MRVTTRSRKARSCDTVTTADGVDATNDSRRSRPAKSRSLVGSSRRSTSWRDRRMAASAARAGLAAGEVADLHVDPVGRQAHLGEHRARRGRRGRRRRGRGTARAPRCRPRSMRRRRPWRPWRRRARPTPRPRRCAGPGRRARRLAGGRRRAPGAASPPWWWRASARPRRRRAPRRPPRIRRSVDLPMPLGPTMPRRVPAVIDTDTRCSTTCAPWWRLRSRATSTGGDATGAHANWPAGLPGENRDQFRPRRASRGGRGAPRGRSGSRATT